jgi:hypothetical protein
MAPFRRMAAACVVACLCLTAGAWGATGDVAHSTKHHPSTRHHHPTTHTKAKGKRRPTKAKKKHQPTSQLTSVSATATPSVTTASPMLFGDQTVESLVDNNKAGMAEAFPFTATTAGQALTLSVYVDSHNKATKLIAGVYSDASGHPGSLLASGSASSPRSGSWDTISLPTIGVTSGQSYWLAILGTGGASYFRDRDAGPCKSITSAQTTLTALPSAWKSGSAWQSCPVSMYVGGTPAKVVSSSDPGTTTTTGSSPLPPLPVPPINVLPPTVSGTTTQGQTLSATSGTWSDSSSSFTYAWQDCDSSGANCAAISGATGGSYALRASDVGHTLRVVVTATNAGGSGSATSNATSSVDPAPVTAPSNSAAPAVSGTATQGKTLATTNGSWNGSPTGYTYAWQDCNSSGASCSAIIGATSMSYTLQASDVGHTIRSTVTASNSGGSASASSAATAVVAAPPAAAPTNTAAPAVTGSPSQGSTLTTSNGSWTGSPTGYTYAWQDCDTSGANCAAISGATSSSYTLAAGDVGSTVRSVVTAENAGGNASAPSAVTAVVTGSVSGGGGGGGSTSCDLNATTSNFSSQVSAASAGQTICLASGNYGTWGGTSKAITVAAAPNATPTMQLSFGSGDSGFTISGIGGMGGEMDSGAKNITIENSAFTDPIVFNGVSNANLVLDGDTFLNINNPGCTGQPARIHLYNSSGQTGVTVENSLFSGGDTDGIQTGAPLTILNNVFTNLRSSSSDCNHTDSVQLYGGNNVVASGNLFYNDYDGIVAFDGTAGNTITDNACYDIDRGVCITLYSDDGSVVNHNTAGPGMNLLELDRKSADPAGKNTVFENNVGDASVSDGSTMATDTNNLYSGARSPDVNGSPSFTGGPSPTTWAGYELTSTSSGHAGATDGSDVGIRAGTGGPPASLQ